MPIRDASAAELSQAAHGIRLLVQEAPERLLWAPGHALWGLALTVGWAGSAGDAGDTALLAVDGALSIVALQWPGHIRPGACYALDRLVRHLADDLPLVHRPPAPVLTCALPGAACGRLCVRLLLSGLPWLRPPAEVAPLAGPVAWQAPSAPEDAALVPGIHPWTRWALRAPPAADPLEFLAELPATPEAPLLPEPWRRQRLLAQARAALRLERTRLELAGLPAPAWMRQPPALSAAVLRWSDDPLLAACTAESAATAAGEPPCISPA